MDLKNLLIFLKENFYTIFFSSCGVHGAAVNNFPAFLQPKSKLVIERRILLQVIRGHPTYSPILSISSSKCLVWGLPNAYLIIPKA